MSMYVSEKNQIKNPQKGAKERSVRLLFRVMLCCVSVREREGGVRAMFNNSHSTHVPTYKQSKTHVPLPASHGVCVCMCVFFPALAIHGRRAQVPRGCGAGKGRESLVARHSHATQARGNVPSEVVNEVHDRS